MLRSRFELEASKNCDDREVGYRRVRGLASLLRDNGVSNPHLTKTDFKIRINDAVYSIVLKLIDEENQPKAGLPGDFCHSRNPYHTITLEQDCIRIYKHKRNQTDQIPNTTAYLVSKLYLSHPPRAFKLSHLTVSSASVINSMIRLFNPSFSS